MSYLIRSLRELKNFIVVVFGVAIIAFAIVYGKLLYNIGLDFLGKDNHALGVQDVRNHGIATVITTPIKIQDDNFAVPHVVLENLLHKRIEKTSFAFNMLPPGHRIIVDSLGIKAPVVDVQYADHEKLEKGDFYEELKSGVVRYPYTAIPGGNEKGNSVLFGHSSVEVWDRGNYGFVFQKLPKINIGESIKVIRDGNLYSYQVDHKVIKRPKDVSKELASRNDNSYLTLMACYPLLSDAQRILVRGKLIPIQPSAVAFSTNTANNL